LDVDEELFQKLRVWRLARARAQGMPPYVVFHDRHLRAIAAHRPLWLDALSEVKGVGPHKLEEYGAELIELVREHLKGATSDAQT
jgi:ATP-dependent DNA helicase RecQ